jgi:hypothetical protein
MLGWRHVFLVLVISLCDFGNARWVYLLILIAEGWLTRWDLIEVRLVRLDM